MGTSSQTVAPARCDRVAARPGALALWHLLSLDAPTVAALWSIFLARALRLRLPLSAPVAIFLAVWVIYAADRLLDARRQFASGSLSSVDLEARHLFHHAHRHAFQALLPLAAICLIPLLLRMPNAVRGLYLLLALFFLAWFALIHLAAKRDLVRIPKELAVGFFFAAATLVPTLARTHQPLLLFVVPALFFANLASLNCLFIYAWEHDQNRVPTRAHPTTRFGLRRLKPLALTSIALPLLLLPFTNPLTRPVLLAAGLSAALLLLLHRSHRRIDRTNLRAAADLALLTPLLILPFLA